MGGGNIGDHNIWLFFRAGKLAFNSRSTVKIHYSSDDTNVFSVFY